MSEHPPNVPDIDPTRNVLDLVAAAITRQDDLRAAVVKESAAAVASLRDLMENQFRAIAHELSQNEANRKEQKLDTKVAVDAALSAAEKAVKEQAASSEKAILKSETSAAEQSKALAASFKAEVVALTQSQQDVKDRVIRIESNKAGSVETRGEQRLNVGVVVGVVAILLSLATFITMILKSQGG